MDRVCDGCGYTQRTGLIVGFRCPIMACSGHIVEVEGGLVEHFDPEVERLREMVSRSACTRCTERAREAESERDDARAMLGLYALHAPPGVTEKVQAAYREMKDESA